MPRPAPTVTVAGRPYPVLDRLGWQPSRGVYAVEVRDGDRERVAVGPTARGPWAWNVPVLLVPPARPRKDDAVSRQSEWQKKRAAAGLCRQCGVNPGVPRCPACLAKARQHMRRKLGCRPHRPGGPGRPPKGAGGDGKA